MHDRTLIAALAKLLDRCAYALGRGDDAMAALYAAVVPIYMAHSDAVTLADDLGWRRQLARWRTMRSRVGALSAESSDVVVHLARVLLIEAAREVARAEASAA
jgi:hypothetical protein